MAGSLACAATPRRERRSAAVRQQRRRHARRPLAWCVCPSLALPRLPLSTEEMELLLFTSTRTDVLRAFARTRLPVSPPGGAECHPPRVGPASWGARGTVALWGAGSTTGEPGRGTPRWPPWVRVRRAASIEAVGWWVGLLLARWYQVLVGCGCPACARAGSRPAVAGAPTPHQRGCRALPGCRAEGLGCGRLEGAAVYA